MTSTREQRASCGKWASPFPIVGRCSLPPQMAGNMIILSEWTAITCGICVPLSGKRIGIKFLCCWISADKAGMWLILGILEILMLLGTILTAVAALYYKGYSLHIKWCKKCPVSFWIQGVFALYTNSIKYYRNSSSGPENNAHRSIDTGNVVRTSLYASAWRL